jgi:hypothetical protein
MAAMSLYILQQYTCIFYEDIHIEIQGPILATLI